MDLRGEQLHYIQKETQFKMLANHSLDPMRDVALSYYLYFKRSTYKTPETWEHILHAIRNAQLTIVSSSTSLSLSPMLPKPFPNSISVITEGSSGPASVILKWYRNKKCLFYFIFGCFGMSWKLSLLMFRTRFRLLAWSLSNKSIFKHWNQTKQNVFAMPLHLTLKT